MFECKSPATLLQSSFLKLSMNVGFELTFNNQLEVVEIGALGQTKITDAAQLARLSSTLGAKVSVLYLPVSFTVPANLRIASSRAAFPRLRLFRIYQS